jgi:hypothetical protein
MTPECLPSGIRLYLDVRMKFGHLLVTHPIRDISASMHLKNLFCKNIRKIKFTLEQAMKSQSINAPTWLHLYPHFSSDDVHFNKQLQFLAVWQSECTLYIWYTTLTSCIMSTALNTNASWLCCSHLAVLFVPLQAFLCLALKSSVSDAEQKITTAYEVTRFYYEQQQQNLFHSTPFKPGWTILKCYSWHRTKHSLHTSECFYTTSSC